MALVRTTTAGGAAVAVLVATVAVGDAKQGLAGERAGRSESSAVVPRDAVQLEMGWTHTEDDDQGIGIVADEGLYALLRIGMAEGAELRLGWEGFIVEEYEEEGFVDEVDGVGDLAISAKIALSRGDWTETAVVFGSTIPSGSDDVGSRRLDPSLRLSVSSLLSERVGLDANVGAYWTSEPDPTGERDTLSYALYTFALGVDLTPRVGVFGELFGDLPLSADGGPANGFDAGIDFLVRDSVRLDVSAGTALSEAADDWFVDLGLSARFPRGPVLIRDRYAELRPDGRTP